MEILGNYNNTIDWSQPQTIDRGIYGEIQQQEPGDVDESGSRTGDIIQKALEGLGMATSAWKDTAMIKADAAKYGHDTQRKYTPIAIIGMVSAGVVVLILGAILVIRTSK